MDNYTLYQEFVKPSWAPPGWLFSPVWLFLYAVIIISFGTVFYRVYKRKLHVAIAIPFFMNLVFNVVFTNIQFGLRNNLLASIDILLVLTTIVWSIIAIWPKTRWIAYAQFPYLIWVTFATILQLTVTYLNW